MKLSEFIERLQELKTVHGGDPEVAIDAQAGAGASYYETANAQLQFVELIDDADCPYMAKSKNSIMPEGSPQIVVVF